MSTTNLRDNFAAGHARALTTFCGVDQRTWWHDPATGERIDRPVGTLLMLTVSELAEAMEGDRKHLMDDKLPHRSMLEVELADALIRIFDMAYWLDLDVGGALAEKAAYNRERADHKSEQRTAPGGKRY